MFYNYLSSKAKRTVTSSNYNVTINSCHPDRIMTVHDLVYITDGTWSISQEGVDYPLAPNDVFLLHRGLHHYGLVKADIVKLLFIEFEALEDDHANAEGDAPSLSGSEYAIPVLLHCGNHQNIRTLFKEIITSHWSDDPYEKAKEAARLDILLCELCGVAHRKEPMSAADNIKQALQNNTNRFISNAELAEMCHSSVRSIETKFKESTGMTIHAWQIRLKCQMAEELIKGNPSITLRDLAATFGFYDEYHFDRSFKKAMGHTPKAAR